MMTPRKRRFLAICLIVVIVVGIGLGVYFLFFRTTDTAMYVRRIGPQEIVDFKPADYRESRLHIYPYGAFEIELILTTADDKQIILFSGNGIYTRAGGEYTLIYADSFYREGGSQYVGIEQREAPPQSKTLQMDGGRVKFTSPWGILFYFGR